LENAREMEGEKERGERAGDRQRGERGTAVDRESERVREPAGQRARERKGGRKREIRAGAERERETKRGTR